MSLFKRKTRTAAKKSEQDVFDGEEEATIVAGAGAAKRQKTGGDPDSQKNTFTSQKPSSLATEFKTEVRNAGIYTISEEYGVQRAQTGKDFATRTFNMDADHSVDQRAILERNEAICKEVDDGNLDTSVYRGAAATKQYIAKNPDAVSRAKIRGTMGPVRGNNTIRSAARFDFWGTSGDGGVCKEYQQTGFCGRGDSCLYMHDRSIYKSGWQIEADWQAKVKRKEKRLKRKMELARKVDEGGALTAEELQEQDEIEEWELNGSDEEEQATNTSGKGGPAKGGLASKGGFMSKGGGSSSSSSSRKKEEEGDGQMPVVCGICKEAWETTTARNSPPVTTSCGHYFCEACAMKQFRTSKRCFQCGEKTDGIFNNCEEVWEKQKLAKEQRRKERLEELENKVRSGKSGVGLNLPYQVKTDKGRD